jgi:hypothetical protein
MQALEIGQRVIVKAVSTLGYECKQRVVDRHSIVAADAVITGRTIRYLGHYHKATGGSYGGFEDSYNLAFLGVTGSVELWCVRFGTMNREHWVQDADLEPGSVQPPTPGTYFQFPKRAKRIV